VARILIIDDDSALRQTMVKIVSKAGHTADQAEDGQVGLSLFQGGAYDLVVTDLLMPEKEGIETIIELREHKPDVKILAVSGGLLQDRTGPLEDAEALGADASLPKPFSVDEFTTAVNNLLER
jgi:DNA-binding response OmpR family regulator